MWAGRVGAKMAYRTTPAAVQGIIQVDTLAVSDLSPYIAAANNIVTRVCITDPLTTKPTGYDADTLAQIELWLSAHFYAIRDPRLQSQGFGGANGTVQGQTSFNFASTSYGQQAMLLDINGGLAWLSEHRGKGKRGVVGVVSLGCHRPLRGGLDSGDWYE